MSFLHARAISLVPFRIACLAAFGLAHWPHIVVAQTPERSPADVRGVSEEIAALKQRITDLERQVAREGDVPPPVDLSEREVDTLEPAVELGEESGPSNRAVVDVGGTGAGSAQTLDRGVAEQPWFRNFALSGFAALEYVDAGSSSTRPFGGFSIRESSLFVEAAAWKDVSFFVEVQVNRLGKDKDLFLRTGEVHAHWRNLLKKWGNDLLGLKVGRVDIPFGEDYLSQDAIDNPLMSFSAAYPYGFDEGVVAYGKLRGVSWIAAVTDGTDDRSLEDNNSKALNVKLYGRPHSSIYLSTSVMRTGRTSESALEFGGSHIEPIGTGHASSLGKSPSPEVSGVLYEADATLYPSSRSDVSFSLGTGAIADDAATFGRELTWFSVQPRYRIRPELYVIGRYSEIGTYDDARGYHFDGKTTAGGNGAFGYDVRRFQRLSIGAGFRPNPRVLLKAELGRDWFDTIAASAFDGSDDDRSLFGFSLVVGF